MISYAEFKKVELHVGKIVEVNEFPQARNPSYQLRIDFGETIGIKQSSAQVTNYERTTLVGKYVICVTNFPPKQIANFMSEVLVLGVDTADKGLALLVPDFAAPLGSRIY